MAALGLHNPSRPSAEQRGHRAYRKLYGESSHVLIAVEPTIARSDSR